jgi:hypothetical protein
VKETDEPAGHWMPTIRWAIRFVTATACLFPIAIVSAHPAQLAEVQASPTARFSAQGHPKSLGLDFTLQYPGSWRGAEGDAPDVVQKFLAANGTGSNCNVVVRDAAGASAAEIHASLQPTNAREMIPPGSELVGAQATSLDGLPAIEIQLRQRPSVAGRSLEIRQVVFMTFYRQHTLSIVCTAGGATAGEADARYATYLAVFRTIAGSIVFPDQHR